MSDADDDILSITDAQLVADLFASYLDVEVCEDALKCGWTEYGGKWSIPERLDRNRELIGIIRTEQERRKGVRRA